MSVTRTMEDAMRKAAGLMLTTALLLGGGVVSLGPVTPAIAVEDVAAIEPVLPEAPEAPVVPVLPGSPEAPETSEEGDPSAPVLPTITRNPAISAAKVGTTTIADLGAWELGDATIPTTLEWLVDGAAVAGETSEAFVPNADTAGKQLELVVWLHVDGMPPLRLISNSVKIAPGTLSLGTVSVTGTAAVGQSLTASRTAAHPAETAATYQWLRSGAVIAGATSAKYVLTAADLGKTISVRVTGTHAGYEATSVLSNSTAKVVVGTLASVTPKITGSAIVGKTLTGSTGTWAPSGTKFGYQWLRNGAAISGAKTSTYKLTSSDAGKKISLRVTGTNAGFTTKSVTSASTGVVLRTLTATPTPSISGTATVGSTVTAKAGSWAPAKVDVSYQWLRDGSAIKGATRASYKLTSGDAGKKISVRVTGKKSGYLSVAKTSGSKAVPRVLKTAAPTISGTKQFGSTLTVNRGSWTASTKLTTQWLRNGAAIKGATGTTYKLTSADVGKKISVRVTGTKSGYSTASRTSGQTAAVTYPNRVTVYGWDCPAWAPIKGNASSKIYHVRGGAYYNRTKPEECFRTTGAAVAAGYRASKR